MAPSPRLQLRCLTSLLCAPILILRPQLSSLGWFQPPVGTAACPRPCQLPPSLSRRQRLAVTKTLNNQWQELPPPVVWDPLLPWRPDPSPVRWHRRRACHHQQRRQAWAGWPHRGMRIGETRIRDPLSLAHLLGGKGLPRDGRKLNGCFARFQHVLALTQLGPGVGPQLQR